MQPVPPSLCRLVSGGQVDALSEGGRTRLWRLRVLTQALASHLLANVRDASGGPFLAVTCGMVTSFPTKICMVEHVLFPTLPTTIPSAGDAAN